MLFIWETLIEIMEYMVEFVTNIRVIKDICEVITNSFVIIKFLLLLQIGPKTWTTLFFEFKIFIIIIL